MNTLTLPDHVSPELVHRYSLYEIPTTANVFSEIAKLHEKLPPIFWNPTPFFFRGLDQGAWNITSIDHIREIMRDTETFSSVGISGFNQLVNVGYELMIPIDCDPPLHTQMRGLIRERLLPQNVAKLEDRIRDLARSLVQRAVAKGSCEVVSDIAAIYPTQIFLLLMGLPLDEADEFLAWEKDLLQPDPNNLDKMRNAIGKIIDRVKRGFEERRKNPADDFLTLLVNAEVDGRPLPDELRLGLGFNLFVGGLDTVLNQLTWLFHFLATQPDIRRRIRGDSKLISSTIEEILRLHSILTTRRFVTRDVEFHGVQFKKGDSVEMFMAAAGSDPTAFPNPEAIDIERLPNRHLAFGWGPHMCVGMHLARLEMRILVEEWLNAVPEFTLDPQKPVVFHVGILGLDQVPLVWK